MTQEPRAIDDEARLIAVYEDIASYPDEPEDPAEDEPEEVEG